MDKDLLWLVLAVVLMFLLAAMTVEAQDLAGCSPKYLALDAAMATAGVLYDAATEAP